MTMYDVLFSLVGRVVGIGTPNIDPSIPCLIVSIDGDVVQVKCVCGLPECPNGAVYARVSSITAIVVHANQSAGE